MPILCNLNLFRKPNKIRHSFLCIKGLTSFNLSVISIMPIKTSSAHSFCVKSGNGMTNRLLYACECPTPNPVYIGGWITEKRCIVKWPAWIYPVASVRVFRLSNSGRRQTSCQGDESFYQSGLQPFPAPTQWRIYSGCLLSKRTWARNRLALRYLRWAPDCTSQTLGLGITGIQNYLVVDVQLKKPLNNIIPVGLS